MYVDCKVVNNIIVKYRHPIPCLDDLLDELHSTCYFSKVDVKSWYHQIRIREGMNGKEFSKLNMACMNGWLCLLDLQMLLALL